MYGSGRAWGCNSPAPLTDGLDRDEDACSGADAQHELTAAMNRVTSDTSVSMWSLTTMPLGKQTSATDEAAAIVTGTNRCGAGALSGSLSLRRHVKKQLTVSLCSRQYAEMFSPERC